MKYKYLALAPIAMAGALLRQNKKIKVTKYTLPFKSLPIDFNNYKIAHVSDIHCDKVGYSDLSFLNKLRKFDPDIIVITGDILDSYKNNMDVAYNALCQLSSIATCYFVTGNHELRLDKEREELKLMLEKLNITYLSNNNITLSIGDSEINLVGVEDYNYFKFKDNLYHRENFKNMLNKLFSNNKFNILLSHRPEKFNLYVEEKYDLVFSGHAHGGQWQIPFIGGIFSPTQGFFPEFYKGIHKKDNTTLVISQGLGNSSFPLRINNLRELILVTLKKED